MAPSEKDILGTSPYEGGQLDGDLEVPFTYMPLPCVPAYTNNSILLQWRIKIVRTNTSPFTYTPLLYEERGLLVNLYNLFQVFKED